MLILPGSPERVAGHVSRRKWLEVGGIGALGLTLPQVLTPRMAAADEVQPGAGFGRAKSCILLFLFGAPAHSAVTPEDLAATIYHLLGIDPEMRVRDASGRPFSVSLGTPVWPLLG